MPVAGAIAERVRGIIPITWDALSLDERYGDALLRTAIDIVKERVFGTVIAPIAESTYPLIVIDYVAKLAAIDLINSGIDFWLSNPISESSTGTNENHIYEERATNLRQLREDLLKETRLAQGEVAGLIGYRRMIRQPRPLINTMDEDFVTPSPLEFPRPYRITDRS